ncbi:hypothetical protein AB0A73_21530 [Glycomyces sp. NPDC047369]
MHRQALDLQVHKHHSELSAARDRADAVRAERWPSSTGARGWGEYPSAADRREVHAPADDTTTHHLGKVAHATQFK